MPPRPAPSVLQVIVHAVPGARSSAAMGAHGDALRVRLAAPAVEGKANAELLRWAAQAFGVARSAVQLARGTSSRRKVLVLRFDTPAALAQGQALLAAWMGAQGADEI